MFKKSIIIWCLCITTAYASVGGAGQIYRKYRGKKAYYHLVAKELVKGGFYYSAIPFIKEYLVYHSSGRIKSSVDATIDKIISEVGVKQFEVLPFRILKNSSSPIINYIIAKKYLRRMDYKNALRYLKGTIPSDHPVKPFALLLEASIQNPRSSAFICGAFFSFHTLSKNRSYHVRPFCPLHAR